MAELLRNVPLSSNPCPSCIAASEEEPKTLAEWEASEYGIPGSDARLCDGYCHCIFVPEDVVDDFPAISDKVMLRGETGSDIRAIVDLAPSEAGLKDIMDQWNADIGKLPQEIYSMPLAEVEAYLRKKYAAWLVGRD